MENGQEDVPPITQYPSRPQLCPLPSLGKQADVERFDGYTR